MISEDARDDKNVHTEIIAFCNLLDLLSTLLHG